MQAHTAPPHGVQAGVPLGGRVGRSPCSRSNTTPTPAATRRVHRPRRRGLVHLPEADALLSNGLSHVREVLSAHFSSSLKQAASHLSHLKLNQNKPDDLFALIDCPPSLGMTLTQALLASSHVIVPIAPQYYPLEGVLASTIHATKRPNPSLFILGYLMTPFDIRTSVSREALAKIFGLFPTQLKR